MLSLRSKDTIVDKPSKMRKSVHAQGTASKDIGAYLRLKMNVCFKADWKGEKEGMVRDCCTLGKTAVRFTLF